MTAFRRFLAHLRARLDAERVPFVVGGSFALAARGVPRFTRDIDIMVMVPDLGPVHKAMAAGKLEWINEVTFRDETTGLLVDIIPVDDAAHRHAFDSATLTDVGGGAEARVLSPEGCCIMLLREATRGDPQRRPLRLRDIEALALATRIDWSEVRTWAERMGYEAAYGELRVEDPLFAIVGEGRLGGDASDRKDWRA